MAVREIIKINEDLCNGCGDCIVSCEEAALKIVDGKAKLVKEIYCDGLGACLGSCPTGALTIEKREADEFDEEATNKHVAATLVKNAAALQGMPASPSLGSSCSSSGPAPISGGCPGSAARQFKAPSQKDFSDASAMPSALEQWPVQLHLIRPDSPTYQGADVLIAADCTAFACGSFHRDLLNGRRLIIACPKLDDPTGYIEKLSALFRHAAPKSVTVARMQVPCCGGLLAMVMKAHEVAEASIAIEDVVVGVEGEILSRREI